MVGRRRYARQAYPPRHQITYTQRAKHPPDKARPYQPVAIARRTRHRGNEKKAGPSNT